MLLSLKKEVSEYLNIIKRLRIKVKSRQQNL